MNRDPHKGQDFARAVVCEPAIRRASEVSEPVDSLRES
jgi:hypothetical protein